MLLKDVVTKFIRVETRPTLKFLETYHLSKIEIHDLNLTFLQNIANKKLVTLQQYEFFNDSCNILPLRAKHFVKAIVCHIAIQVYASYHAEIKQKQSQIDLMLDDEPLPASLFKKNFDGLFNLHLLQSTGFFTSISTDYDFPFLNRQECQAIHDRIPLAINTLALTKAIPSDLGINYRTIKPKQSRLLVEKYNGIKSSSDLFTYRNARELLGSNNDLIATNHRKKYFLRDEDFYSPRAILASKIARFVNTTIFSSEHLFDNLQNVSTTLDAYKLSLDHALAFENASHFIQTDRMFIGVGTIDEVLNFVGDADSSFGNFGFSSADVSSSFMCKIDFGLCKLTKLDVNSYEKNTLSKRLIKINNHPNKQYFYEKLYARLKLSVLTKELITAMADKGYIDIFPYHDLRNLDATYKDRDIENLVVNTQLALNLFLTSPHNHEFLKENPAILDEIQQSAVDYIQSHFAKSQHATLILTLQERVDSIRHRIYNAYDHTKTSLSNPAAVLSSDYVKQLLSKIDQFNSPSFFEPLLQVLRNPKIAQYRQTLGSAAKQVLAQMHEPTSRDIRHLAQSLHRISHVIDQLLANENDTHMNKNLSARMIENVLTDAMQNNGWVNLHRFNSSPALSLRAALENRLKDPSASFAKPTYFDPLVHQLEQSVAPLQPGARMTIQKK